CRGQRPGRHFRDTSRLRATETALSRVCGFQSHGKLNTAARMRLCAGLRGGARRTRTCNQAIMEPRGNHQRPRRSDAWRQEYGPIDIALTAQAPSRWLRKMGGVAKDFEKNEMGEPAYRSGRAEISSLWPALRKFNHDHTWVAPVSSGH